MATTTPTVIVNSSGGVSVDVVGMTYDEFLASLQGNIFRIYQMLMIASSMAQLQELVQYEISDASGVEFTQVLNFAVDPNQKIPSLLVDLRNDAIILNGQSNLNFTLLPGENLTLQLFCYQYSATMDLDVFSDDYINKIDDIYR